MIEGVRTAVVPGVGVAVGDFVELAKPRITGLVVITAIGGFAMAPGPFQLGALAALVVGTALVVGAANALNMYPRARYRSAYGAHGPSPFAQRANGAAARVDFRCRGGGNGGSDTNLCDQSADRFDRRWRFLELRNGVYAA